MRHRITPNRAAHVAPPRRPAPSLGAGPVAPRGPIDPGASPIFPPEPGPTRPTIPPRDLTTSRYGPIGRLIKWAVSLLLSYHTYHQDLVNASLAAAIERLANHQASLTNGWAGAGPAAERLAGLERQIELIRSRLQRIGATLREHDQRIDDLGLLLEELGRTPSNRPNGMPASGDSTVSRPLPSSNGHPAGLDYADGDLVHAVARGSDEAGPRLVACQGDLETLADGIHQVMASVRVLHRQIDAVSGQAASLRRVGAQVAIRPSRPATRRHRRNHRPSG